MELKLQTIKFKCENKMMKTLISHIELDKEAFSTIAKTATETNKTSAETTKTSVSALSYIVKNFPNAPDIEIFNKFNFLEKPSISKLADSILYKHKNKILTPYITDMLIK